MLEVGSLKKAAGLPLTEVARVAEEMISKKINELSLTLKDRIEQTTLANADAEAFAKQQL
jgi:hypothetical protein